MGFCPEIKFYFINNTKHILVIHTQSYFVAALWKEIVICFWVKVYFWEYMVRSLKHSTPTWILQLIKHLYLRKQVMCIIQTFNHLNNNETGKFFIRLLDMCMFSLEICLKRIKVLCILSVIISWALCRGNALE